MRHAVQRGSANVPRRGLTLMEVVLATGLLALAAVPILNGITRATELSRQIELRTTAAMLAQREMEAAIATARDDFSVDLRKSSEDLGEGYLVTIDGTLDGLTKTFSVEVGWDADSSGTLDPDEALVTLATVVTDL